ncbi:UNVERIFIED_CONTAM: hypothetical protein Cloal_3302 [Acetivibrio alkalicellulosi]
MNYKIPGLLSIVLVFISLGIGGYQLFSYSIFLGMIYVLLIPLVFLNVMYQYCRKCPHVAEKTCRHVIFGWIVNKLFTPIKPSKYTLKEIIYALTPLILLILLLQYWLFKNIFMFIVFWIPMLISVIIIRIGVCKECQNKNCAFCTKTNNCSF